MLQSEKGSLPLAMLALVVVMTIATALTKYAVQEVRASRYNADSIQARYTAEGGLEHYIYFVLSKLNETSATETVYSTTYVNLEDETKRWTLWTGPRVEYDGDASVYRYPYLTVDAVYDLPGTPPWGDDWPSSVAENRLGQKDYYRMLSLGTVKNDGEDDGADPSFLLPMNSVFTSPLRDSFVLQKIRIRSNENAGGNMDAPNPKSKTTEADVGFNVRLEEDPDATASEIVYSDVYYLKIDRTWKMKVED